MRRVRLLIYDGPVDWIEMTRAREFAVLGWTELSEGKRIISIEVDPILYESEPALAYLIGQADAANQTTAQQSQRRESITERAERLGWSVDRVSCYDEEGVEGWKFVSPEGREFTLLGAWDEEPPWGLVEAAGGKIQ